MEKMRETTDRKKTKMAGAFCAVVYVRTLLTASLLAAAVLLASCKAAEDNSYKLLTDDLAAIMLAQDQDSQAYDQALEAVSRYLETMGPEDLERAREAVDDGIRQMTEALDDSKPYELSGELSDILKKYEMDPEGYKVNADMRSVRLSDYMSKLDNLKSKLDLVTLPESQGTSKAATAPADSRGTSRAAAAPADSPVQTELREMLRFWVSYYTRYQLYMRTYAYYSINYWFCQWDQEKTAYVEEQILSRLGSFNTADAVWEQDRAAVERKMRSCMDGLDELEDELEAYIGAMQAEVYGG